MRRHRDRKSGVSRLFRRTLVYGVLVASCLFFLGPILWIFFSSIRNPVNANSIPPVWLSWPILDQYASILWREPIWHELFNSVVIVGCSVFISSVVGSAAAYGISRMEQRVGNVTSFLFLLYRMIPLIVLVIPVYELSKALGLYDTHLALILAYTNISIPVAVWLMVDFFNALPLELEEAAMLDGCSRLRCFLHVALPLAAPGLVTTVVFCTVLAWSDFLLAVLLTGPHTKTLNMALRGAGGREGAISVVVLLPFLLVALLVQKRFIQGLSWGAVKE